MAKREFDKNSIPQALFIAAFIILLVLEDNQLILPIQQFE